MHCLELDVSTLRQITMRLKLALQDGSGFHMRRCNSVVLAQLLLAAHFPSAGCSALSSEGALAHAQLVGKSACAFFRPGDRVAARCQRVVQQPAICTAALNVQSCLEALERALSCRCCCCLHHTRHTLVAAAGGTGAQRGKQQQGARQAPAVSKSRKNNGREKRSAHKPVAEERACKLECAHVGVHRSKGTTGDGRRTGAAHPSSR